ncbi:glycine cleavage T C-terminal barrel domain-containing protein [Hyphococcus flavus]|uniref:Glycine cleavage T C-terminal barrel domain-containing protein n=1 Tax=Hyphococcus flavus TaxID=1866326 RepID=A0AAE9ZFT6_9PROT|nr:glycine cleavage T C-terminal barrel domain-containing protein [Hyphococcus flavus]WDI32133.1 glycine cleavage T C-terminal barrel domain-containing protein [Hyphococcus flavus]
MIFPGEDILVDSPRTTPLFPAVASASEANLWTSINGWTAARIYSSVSEEYEAAKSAAVLADLGPLTRYSVRGGDAADFLSRLSTAPAAGLQVGESARGLILDDDGLVVDLVEVSRLSEALFVITVPSPHGRRIQLARRGMDVNVDDISGQVAALGVFGPQTSAVLSAAGLKSVNETIAASSVLRGVETAARPIQFGALPGVELIFPKEEALTIWERIMRRSAGKPIGVDTLEILRLESGAPRPGIDFIAADRARKSGESGRTPEEIGLAHLAPLDRGWFNGRRGLRERAGRPENRLISLAIDDEKTMRGAAVFQAGKKAGKITSFAWSPSRKRVVAFADISAATYGKDYEISLPAPAEGVVAARRLDTPESALASAFANEQGGSSGAATDFRR